MTEQIDQVRYLHVLLPSQEAGREGLQTTRQCLKMASLSSLHSDWIVLGTGWMIERWAETSTCHHLIVQSSSKEAGRLRLNWKESQTQEQTRWLIWRRIILKSIVWCKGRAKRLCKQYRIVISHLEVLQRSKWLSISHHQNWEMQTTQR